MVKGSKKYCFLVAVYVSLVHKTDCIFFRSKKQKFASGYLNKRQLPNITPPGAIAVISYFRIVGNEVAFYLNFKRFTPKHLETNVNSWTFCTDSRAVLDYLESPCSRNLEYIISVAYAQCVRRIQFYSSELKNCSVCLHSY